jgi:hypothetical protein
MVGVRGTGYDLLSRWCALQERGSNRNKKPACAGFLFRALDV